MEYGEIRFVKAAKAKKIEFDIAAVRAALKAPASAADLEQGRMGYGRFGCHRAYLEVLGSGEDYGRKGVNAALKALEAAGARIMSLHGCGGGKGVYLGYDNCEGGKLAAQGIAAVRALRQVGIACCVEAAGD